MESHNQLKKCGRTVATDARNTESIASDIEILPDDCLINIFEYLPILDRIKCESVSKRWHRLVKKSWSSFKHFNLKKHTWTHTEQELERIIDDQIFKKLITLFGKYLISIDLSCNGDKIQHQLTPDSLREICRVCCRLQALDIDDLLAYKPRVAKIVQKLQNWKLLSSLKSFGIQVLHAKDNRLSNIVSKLKSVESLRLAFDFRCNGEDVLLPEFSSRNLREIIIEGCNTLPKEFLVQVLKNIPEPETLVLMNLEGYDVLDELSLSQSKSIKSLSTSLFMEYDFDNLHPQIRSFQNFTNLEHLNLTYNVSLVTDDTILSLATHCRKLSCLYLSSNNLVTDNGIQHIVSLPKLKCLFIQNLENITGKTLKRMENLEILDCLECPNLEDEGLCAVVKNSRLRVLNVEECEKLTNKLLDTVVEEVNARQNKLDLTFAIDSTNIDVSQIDKLPPMLCLAEKYELTHYYSAFNKADSHFPAMGPFGVKAYPFNIEQSQQMRNRIF